MGCYEYLIPKFSFSTQLFLQSRVVRGTQEEHNIHYYLDRIKYVFVVMNRNSVLCFCWKSSPIFVSEHFSFANVAQFSTQSSRI